MSTHFHYLPSTRECEYLEDSGHEPIHPDMNTHLHYLPSTREYDYLEDSRDEHSFLDESARRICEGYKKERDTIRH